jgi:hypothetical protein
MFTNDLSFEEFAAQWGCDPAYDRAPRKPGDGYLFYNFAVEKNDPEFLAQFIPAIERTIQLVQGNESNYDVDDLDNLQELLEYAKKLKG